jgi:hypothetical protein
LLLSSQQLKAMRTLQAALATGAWTRDSFADEAVWTYAFSARQLGELASACDRLATFAAASGRCVFDELMPSLATTLDGHARELRDGRGFVRLRGLPLDAWASERARIAFWLIGSRFGRGVNQTA